jgi:hypothetical protein
MPPAAFERFLGQLDSMETDAAIFRCLRQSAKHRDFTSAQLANIVGLFEEQEDQEKSPRLEALEIVAPRLVDRDRAGLVLKQLSTIEDRATARELLFPDEPVPRELISDPEYVRLAAKIEREETYQNVVDTATEALTWLVLFSGVGLVMLVLGFDVGEMVNDLIKSHFGGKRAELEAMIQSAFIARAERVPTSGSFPAS